MGWAERKQMKEEKAEQILSALKKNGLLYF